MDCGLDTSALMRIVTTDPPEIARAVAKTLESIVASGGTIHVSDMVVQEAYHALQFHYGATKENAISDLLALSKTPGFLFSEGAKSALAQPNAAHMSPSLMDRMIASDYSAQGLQTISCEKSFRRLPTAIVVSEAGSPWN